MKEQYSPYFFPDEEKPNSKNFQPPGKTFDGYLLEDWVFGNPWFYKKDIVYCNSSPNENRWIFKFPIKLINNKISNNFELNLITKDQKSFLKAKSDSGSYLWSISVHNKLWDLVTIDDINYDGVDDFIINIGDGTVFTKYIFIISINTKYSIIPLIETYESILAEPFGVKDMNGGILRNFWYNNKTKDLYINYEIAYNDYILSKNITLIWDSKSLSWKLNSNEK
ncbi:hypothetical protein [Leptospira jelokensis]|uniref:hypothetical protein n=1 Tax=Leptospira jelokensis TaxID=2484931 RepID=UPI001091350E|nr:hypothetical protein [Leptospira jelokensis]TGM04607.1 hypothetical protein EHQ79_05925 [Leptospira jelokensis]